MLLKASQMSQADAQNAEDRINNKEDFKGALEKCTTQFVQTVESKHRYLSSQVAKDLYYVTIVSRLAKLPSSST
jgi:hypothetical protein